MKKCILLCMLLASRACVASDVLSFTKSQATEYISQQIDSFVDTDALEAGYASTIKQFKFETTNKLLAYLGRYQADFWSLKSYTSDELDKGLLEELLAFIEQQAHTIAQQAIKRFLISYQVDEQKIVQRVSIVLRHKAHKLLTQKVVNPGVLARFIGTVLKKKVQKHLKRELKQIPPSATVTLRSPPIATLYTTKECPLCFERFSAEIKRIFLPCGHNSCLTCLKKRYAKKRETATCAHCPASLMTIKDMLD